MILVVRSDRLSDDLGEGQCCSYYTCACMHACMLSHFNCVQLCDPMNCSLPGSPVHGILQARILEWFAIPSSRYCPNPGIKHSSPALQVDSLPSKPPEKPTLHYAFCQMNLAPCSSPSGTMIVTMLYSSFSKT